jgi:hypothetical protein
VILEQLVEMFPEIRLPIIVPIFFLELFDYAPFADEFLFPASKVLLISRNVVEAHPRSSATTTINGVEIAKCPVEVPGRQD